MILELNEYEALFVQAILLEKMIVICDRCEAELMRSEFNEGAETGADSAYRLLSLILDRFEQ